MSSVISLPDDDLDVDDDFVTQGWHKVPKECDKSAKETCKEDEIYPRIDNRDDGLYVILWQF
jgi:hypothetical protein